MPNWADEFRDVMVHRFMEMNGFLCSFNPEVRPPRSKDARIAGEFGRELAQLGKGPGDEFFGKAADFLLLDPFPSDLVGDCTNLWFRNPAAAKKWLTKMLSIARGAYVRALEQAAHVT